MNNSNEIDKYAAQKIKIDLVDYSKIDRKKVVKGEIVGPDFGGLSNKKLSLFG